MPEHTLSPAYLQRFGGIARLYGTDALTALSQAHMAVIGIGGVGTWTAEALARSGVGEITLFDLDDICVTNINRQAHALTSTVGQAKAEVLAKRLTDINPDMIVNPVLDFVERENIHELISPDFDIVIDAMDAAHTKAVLIAYCLKRKIRLITVGSSGGKRDPRLVTSNDLGRIDADPMLHKVRDRLYRKHNFSKDKGRKFRVDAVFSTEQMVYPKPDGSVCMQKNTLQDGVKLDCSGGFGSATMVTGTFGFVAATKAIERYLTKALNTDH